MVGRIQIAACHDVFWGTHCNVRVRLLQFLPESTTSVSDKRSQRSDECLVGTPRFFGTAVAKKTESQRHGKLRAVSVYSGSSGGSFVPAKDLNLLHPSMERQRWILEVILGDLRGEVRLDGSFGISLPSIRCLATSTSSTRLSLKLCCAGVLSGSPFPPRYILLKR